MNDLISVWYTQLIKFIPKFIVACAIAAGFWVGSRVLWRLIIASARGGRVDFMVIKLLANAAQVSVLVFGILTALGTLGVNINALIAGLGLTGFALGLAFKDALSNFLAGVIILFYHPFRIGQKISITGLEGIVLDIDLRYTTLDTEKNRVLIPNSNILTNSIIILDYHGIG